MIPLKDENPTRVRPVVNLGLIVACVAVFLWQLSMTERGQAALILGLGFIPATLLGDARLAPGLERVPPVATLLTAMFLHGGWLHLAGNMLYLYIFGNNVEDAMGHGRYALFYVLCGVAAALAEAIPNPGSTVPMIGASGAISGVLGAYLLLHPRARVLMFVPFVWPSSLLYVPAAAVLGVWFLVQVVSSLFAGSEEGGVAWGAHVAGFVAGMLLVPLFKRRDVRLFG